MNVVPRLTGLIRDNRGAVLGMLGGSGGKVVTLAATLILAATFATIEYAHFAALHLTAYTIGSLLASGTSIATNHQAAAGAQRSRIVLFSASMALIVLALSWLFFESMFAWMTGPEHTFSVGGAFLVPPAIVLADNGLASLAGRGLFKRAAYFEAARGALSGTGMIAIGTSLGPVYAVVSIAVVDFVIGFLILANYKPRSGRSFPTGKSGNVSIAVQGTLGATSALTAAWIAQAFITRTYGIEVFAAYNLAVRLTNLVLLPPNFAARNLLGQLLTSASQPDVYRRLVRSYAALLTTTTVATCVLVLVGSYTLLSSTIQRYGMNTILLAMLGIVVVRVANNFFGNIAISVGKRGVWVATDVLAAGIVLLAVAAAQGITSATVFILITFGLSVTISVVIRGMTVRQEVRARSLRSQSGGDTSAGRRMM